jgi:hypothetical protein
LVWRRPRRSIRGRECWGMKFSARQTRRMLEALLRGRRDSKPGTVRNGTAYVTASMLVTTNGHGRLSLSMTFDAAIVAALCAGFGRCDRARWRIHPHSVFCEGHGSNSQQGKNKFVRIRARMKGRAGSSTKAAPGCQFPIRRVRLTGTKAAVSAQDARPILPAP